MTDAPPLFGHAASRAIASLNGDWQILIDTMNRGDLGRFFENKKRDDPGELFEYCFEGADTLRVPGDWNTQTPLLYFYEGVVWYQRDFAVVPTAGNRQFLHFGAVNYRTEVWVNGRSVGRHVGGFTPFACEITGALQAGGNFVVVRVDCRHEPHDVPTRMTDWLHYGGLTRDVLLLEVPETFVENFFVQLERGRSDRIAGWVQLDGPDRAGREVWVRVAELGIEVRGRTRADGRADFGVDANPKLWSPESPKCYAVEVAMEGDRVGDEIGFRTIERHGTDILLNGEPIFLRGVSTHEESPLHDGRAHGIEDAEAVLTLCRELGCNFVRLAHYPHDEHMLRAADRMGMLVWAEIPMYWGIAWQNPDTLGNAKRQLRELVARDHNRAAVVLWSMSNETPAIPERTKFLTELADHTRVLDPTRLITSALFGDPGRMFKQLREFVAARSRGEVVAPLRIVLDDPIAEVLDVVGWNEYMGWYYSGFIARQMDIPEREIRRIVLESMPHFEIVVASGKPLIISECGAGAKQGLHGAEDELWTEEYQARVYRQQLAMLANAPAWRGITPWILKDFRAPLRLLPGIQDGFNRKGLVSETGEKKAAFAVLRDFYRDLAS